jgi:hypothetical protein
LIVAINVEAANDRKFDSKFFFEDLDLKEYLMSGKFMVMNGIWIPFVELEGTEVNNNESSDSNKKITIKESYTRCRNLFSGITIDPNHRLLACCGITSKCIEYLDLGNVQQFSIKKLYNRQFNDFMKIWLAAEGAHKIMDFIAEYSDIDESYKTEHACQVCEKILGNPEYLQIVKENHRKIYTNTLLKYFINRKEHQNEIENT